MKYCDLRPAIAAYREGRNVMQTLREILGETANTPQIIEIAYDLQAGSYVDYVRVNRALWGAYTSELAAILRDHLSAGDRVLEAGTGEMTTLAGVANGCYSSVAAHYATDLSWSRIAQGRAFAQSELRPELNAILSSFVGDLLRLPLRDRSIDVVWTSHALEPNAGREREALAELFRVARKRVVLFEPSYEDNSDAGRARMDALGYVRGLPEAIVELGGRLEEKRAISAISNALNPTYAYVITPPGGEAATQGDDVWACPATRLPMGRRGDCYWSEASRLAYPIIGGVPVLREESAVYATGFPVV
jgi:SAM-dependent methyltransferase